MNQSTVLERSDEPKDAIEISDEIAKHIIHEVYPVGSKLPTERTLAQRFGVTRHVIREALKRLESIGLVRIRQGSGIFAERLSIKATVELMHLLIRNEDDSLNFKVLKDVLEYREHISRTMARLAAERRSSAQTARLEELINERRANIKNPEQLEEIDNEFVRTLGRATGNMIFELIYESIAEVTQQLAINFRLETSDNLHIQDLLEELVKAIVDQNPDAGEEIVKKLVAFYREIGARSLQAAPS